MIHLLCFSVHRLLFFAYSRRNLWLIQDEFSWCLVHICDLSFESTIGPLCDVPYRVIKLDSTKLHVVAESRGGNFMFWFFHITQILYKWSGYHPHVHTSEWCLCDVFVICRSQDGGGDQSVHPDQGQADLIMAENCSTLNLINFRKQATLITKTLVSDENRYYSKFPTWFPMCVTICSYTCILWVYDQNAHETAPYLKLVLRSRSNAKFLTLWLFVIMQVECVERSVVREAQLWTNYTHEQHP